MFDLKRLNILADEKCLCIIATGAADITVARMHTYLNQKSQMHTCFCEPVVLSIRQSCQVTAQSLGTLGICNPGACVHGTC